jgi:hypothetical protein
MRHLIDEGWREAILSEDCEDEESFTRKPVTVGKEDK